MDIATITPLILTYNEAPNIGRCLQRLQWASQVIVIDSGSSDETEAIVNSFPNTTLLKRAFDSFASQCNYGLEQISTEWVLSLDADYIVPESYPQQVEQLSEDPTVEGFRFPFKYCVYGKSLRATLYPARTVLYRKESAHYANDGHGHKVQLSGKVIDVSLPIDHDDRKPLSRWLDSQKKYAQLEADKLLSTPTHSLPDRLRKMILPAPPAALFYTLFIKGLLLDGWPGIYYALQRTYAELLLSLELLDRKLKHKTQDPTHPTTKPPRSNLPPFKLCIFLCAGRCAPLCVAASSGTLWLIPSAPS